LLNEICRLREIAFQEVGEGTGKEIDRDQFDDHYLHVFLWDASQEAVAGAYRLAFCDQIIEKKGLEGLYCATLFEFAPSFQDLLPNAIELGRSFVSPSHQNQLGALALLWAGIGRIMHRNPGYSRLYGPVSISNSYTPISRNLIVNFLERHMMNRALATGVTPRNPYRSREESPAPQLDKVTSPDLHAISASIEEVEPDGKGIPVLLKHYLRLNASILSFNVDPLFADALDALMVVEVADIPQTMRDRFLS